MNTENLSSVYFRDGKPCYDFDQHLFTAVLLQAHAIACPSAPISNLTRALERCAKKYNCSLADLLFQAMVDFCVQVELDGFFPG